MCSHARKVRSFAKKTFGSTFTGTFLCLSASGRVTGDADDGQISNQRVGSDASWFKLVARNVSGSRSPFGSKNRRGISALARRYPLANNQSGFQVGGSSVSRTSAFFGQTMGKSSQVPHEGVLACSLAVAISVSSPLQLCSAFMRAKRIYLRIDIFFILGTGSVLGA